MDFIGVLILMGSLICFILALTQGPIDGWKSASFIAPIVLAVPLAIAFFTWGEFTDASNLLSENLLIQYL
jgi:hypothetical protein